jgi:hypothetical protein
MSQPPTTGAPIYPRPTGKPRRLALHAVIARLLDGWWPEDYLTTAPIWVAKGNDEIEPEGMTQAEARIVADTFGELAGSRAFWATVEVQVRATVEAQRERYPTTEVHSVAASMVSDTPAWDGYLAERVAEPEPRPFDLRIRADAPNDLLTDEMRHRRDDHDGGACTCKGPR